VRNQSQLVSKTASATADHSVSRLIAISQRGALEATMKYRVVDIQTGNVMGTFKTLRRANRQVDALDSQYGGYRFTVRAYVEAQS